jgi:hypothetical protein
LVTRNARVPQLTDENAAEWQSVRGYLMAFSIFFSCE